MDDSEDIIVVVQLFIESLYRWESDAWNKLKELDAQGHDDDALYEFIASQDRLVNKLISRFCSNRVPRAAKRPIGSPPEYDPLTENVVNMARRGKKAYVYTERTDRAVFPGRSMYILSPHSGQWRIDEKRELEDGRYRKTYI